MEINELVALIGAITTALNIGFVGYMAWKKNKPEVKKMDAEAESEIVDAANLNLEGAKISAQMLLDRINELKGELEKEKQRRKDSVAALEKSRREDAEYFRRRIKDLERESRDWKTWAAKLAKQVVEAGKIPAPFVPSIGESDMSITAIRTDLENEPEDDIK